MELELNLGLGGIKSYLERKELGIPLCTELATHNYSARSLLFTLLGGGISRRHALPVNNASFNDQT